MKTPYQYFENTIVFALSIMLAFVVLVATIELGYLIVDDLMKPPVFWLEVDDLLDIFGFFLLVLIGVELLESIRAYTMDHMVHAEVVLKVALIAVARKVIILDAEGSTPLTIIGIATLILAIAAAYFVIKKAGAGMLSTR